MSLNVEQERITAAAVKIGCAVFWLPAPARHPDVLFKHPLLDKLSDKELNVGQTQGFMTNHGRFVNRVEAKLIAIDANQLLPPRPNGYTGDQLFSEDVW